MLTWQEFPYPMRLNETRGTFMNWVFDPAYWGIGNLIGSCL